MYLAKQFFFAAHSHERRLCTIAVSTRHSLLTFRCRSILQAIRSMPSWRGGGTQQVDGISHAKFSNRLSLGFGGCLLHEKMEHGGLRLI